MLVRTIGFWFIISLGVKSQLPWLAKGYGEIIDDFKRMQHLLIASTSAIHLHSGGHTTKQYNCIILI